MCEGKMSYHFLCENCPFSDPDYTFFLQTQLLANKLLNGMGEYAFFVQIYIETVRQFAWEEVTDLACWKDKKDIKFLSYEDFGSRLLLEKFSFFTKKLNAVTQNINLKPKRKLEGVISVCAEYYAIKPTALQTEALCNISSEQMREAADFALIGDDTHSVWTILRAEKYTQNRLITNLETFCEVLSSNLHICL